MSPTTVDQHLYWFSDLCIEGVWPERPSSRYVGCIVYADDII